MDGGTRRRSVNLMTIRRFTGYEKEWEYVNVYYKETKRFRGNG